jgi:hypothetical protein
MIFYLILHIARVLKLSQVVQLWKGEQEAGLHEVKFKGGDLASGVCFYRIQAGDFMQTKKLILM